MPTCLITGASGFIGSRTVPVLLSAGWRVHAVVRDLGRAPAGCEAARDDGTVEGLTATMAAMRPDVVLHLATCYLKDHRPDQIVDLVDANITLGLRLLEAMSTAGCRRMVCAGTAWQHLEVDDETYRPATLYAATKQAFEDIARWYAYARGFAITAIHLGDTYGPGDPRPKIFNLLAEAARSGRPLELSPGGQTLDPLHVEDAASAFLCACARLLSGATGFELFRVSPGRPLTLRELVACWCMATGMSPDLRWGARSYREREMMRPWLGGMSLPGWSPTIALESGLAGLR